MIIKVKQLSDGRWHWSAILRCNGATIAQSHFAFKDSDLANRAANRYARILRRHGVEGVTVETAHYSIPVRDTSSLRAYGYRQSRAGQKSKMQFGFKIVQSKAVAG